MSKNDKILKECDGLFYEFVRNQKRDADQEVLCIMQVQGCIRH